MVVVDRKQGPGGTRRGRAWERPLSRVKPPEPELWLYNHTYLRTYNAGVRIMHALHLTHLQCHGKRVHIVSPAMVFLRCYWGVY